MCFFFLLFPRRAAGKREQRPFPFTLISCCTALWKVNVLHLTALFYTYPVIYFVRNLKPPFNSQRKSPLHLNLTTTRHFVAMNRTSQIYKKQTKKTQLFMLDNCCQIKTANAVQWQESSAVAPVCLQRSSVCNKTLQGPFRGPQSSFLGPLRICHTCHTCSNTQELCVNS